MTGWVRRLITGGVPAGFGGTLADEENVLAVAGIAGGGHLVATSFGLWVPHGDGVRRIGWHLISKATWSDGALSVTEAEEAGTAGTAVLITDRPDRSFVLDRPATLPRVVQLRVTGSIRSRHHHDLPGGGAWFVQRKLAGADGLVLQVRVDPGTEVAAVAALAAEVADRIRAVG